MSDQVSPHSAHERIAIELLQLKKDLPDELKPRLQQIIDAVPLPLTHRDETHRDETTLPGLTLPILRKHMVELQNCIDVDMLVPYLLGDELLTRDEEYQLTSSNVPLGPSQRIQTLVSFISRKGPEGPRRLLSCIRRSVIENGRAAGGHSYMDKLLTAAASAESNPRSDHTSCPVSSEAAELQHTVDSIHVQEQRHVQQPESQHEKKFSELL